MSEMRSSSYCSKVESHNSILNFKSQRPVQYLDAILHIQDAFLDAAERLDVPIVDNESFDRAVLLVIRHLTESLRERPGFDPRSLI